LAFSKVIPGIEHQGSCIFGVPGCEWLMEGLIFPGTPGGRHLSASGGAGGVGGDVHHRAQPASHRPTGWRAHSVFVLSRGIAWFRGVASCCCRWPGFLVGVGFVGVAMLWLGGITP
jgi:hypothetical protein